LSTVDPITLVHPELLEPLKRLAARDPSLPGPEDHAVSPSELLTLLPELRAKWVAETSYVPDIARDAEIHKHSIPGKVGQPDLLVYVVKPPSAKPERPAILHMHGGGFIVGSAVEYLPILQAQCLALDCVIVSVEYRLSPETTFPGALDDNYLALSWLVERAGELGIDVGRIALQGESAGGGHAAALAIAARDRGAIPISFLCLTYPMLDDRTGSVEHPPSHVGTFGWTSKTNRMGWSALLGTTAGQERVPQQAVPARVASVAGLPPTFIWVGDLDLFAQENMWFAQRLHRAGVSVEFHLVPGVYHGFDGLAPKADVTIGYKLDMFKAFARRWAQPLASNTLSLISS